MQITEVKKKKYSLTREETSAIRRAINVLEIINNDISGAVHQDRKMLTGDSPLAGNALGKLAANALLQEVGKS